MKTNFTNPNTPRASKSVWNAVGRKAGNRAGTFHGNADSAQSQGPIGKLISQYIQRGGSRYGQIQP